MNSAASRSRRSFSGEEALVYSSGSSLRPDVSGPGYWVFSPARLTGGSLVIVNRGFVPEGQPGPEDAARRPAVAAWPRSSARCAGRSSAACSRRRTSRRRTSGSRATLRRWPPRRGGAPSRRSTSIRRRRPPPGGLPKVGPLKASLPNNHLQYAVTWYGLALVILIAGIVFCARAAARALPDKPLIKLIIFIETTVSL